MAEAQPGVWRATEGNSTLFLPDFCAIRAVFGVVVGGQILAFVLVLAGAGGDGGLWTDLSLVSLFVQWVALTAAGVLCLVRRHLRRLGDRRAGLVGWLLIMAICWGLSEVALVVLQLPASARGPILLRNLTITAIVSALALRYFYVQHQWKRNLEAETQARFEALQARIRPHFLFNSMNTIASLTRSDPVLAEQVVEDLADLFRVTLGEGHHLVTLAEELEHARRYLNIERLRLGERLRVEWALNNLPQGLPVPALTLQPLLENAIYHGIEPLAAGGVIRITGSVGARETRIEIRNPRPPGGAGRASGTRTALDNVRQRLATAFGGDRVEVIEGDAEYCVRVSLPRAEEEAR